jgi:chromosome segregation ATPase
MLIVDCSAHGEIGRVPAGGDEYGRVERLWVAHAVEPDSPAPVEDRRISYIRAKVAEWGSIGASDLMFALADLEALLGAYDQTRETADRYNAAVNSLSDDNGRLGGENEALRRLTASLRADLEQMTVQRDAGRVWKARAEAADADRDRLAATVETLERQLREAGEGWDTASAENEALRAENAVAEDEARDSIATAERVMAERDRLAAQVQRVRDLHQSIPASVLAWACHQDTCTGHESGCPEIEVQVCAECDEIRGEHDDEGSVKPWPCPTIEALSTPDADQPRPTDVTDRHPADERGRWEAEAERLKRETDRLVAQVQRVRDVADRLDGMAGDDRDDDAAVAMRKAAGWIRSALSPVLAEIYPDAERPEAGQ